MKEDITRLESEKSSHKTELDHLNNLLDKKQTEESRREKEIAR